MTTQDEALAAVQADLRALRAALDAAEARERALVAELTVARPIVRAARRLPELGVASPAVGKIIALAVLACGLRDALAGPGPGTGTGDYRRAAGIAPRQPGEEMPEDALRRQRADDGQGAP